MPTPPKKTEENLPQKVIDCVCVIHILSKILLYWLKKTGMHHQHAETFEDLSAIRERSRRMKRRMRNATQESHAKSRYASLFERIQSALRYMEFFE